MNHGEVNMFDVVQTTDGRTGTVVDIYPKWVTLEENPHQSDFPIFDVKISDISKIIEHS
ncbi:hypothetical protein [Levilactobacillus suantsaiihabitans]|uniref:hypothetical protein n=1 Tax=Levilactobacillus suantsaiihabitans TaxID=2487722 RepID=UPI001436824A|nr:hypothetical protein [Levilactobacillus suantsaiihabitans]